MPSKNSTLRGANFKLFLRPGFIIAGLFIFLSSVLSPFSLDLKNIKFTHAEGDNVFIDTDTTWILAGSPYVVNSFLFVNAVLTIEPGVIVKFEQGNLVVNGTLIAQGTETSPIIFTSINDDEAGGKTVPWSTGNPMPGDWGAIQINGGRAVLDKVKMKYGGETCVDYVRAKPIKTSTAYANWCYDVAVISGQGDIAISNSEIFNNIIGLQFFGEGQITISNSKIYNNAGGGLFNYRETQLDARNNWWGDGSGPYHSFLNPEGEGDEIAGDVLFDPWIGKTVALKLNPVILIPGIFGSWSATENGSLELDPITHVYDNLWEALKLACYEQDKSLFAFPYNWRQSNATSSLLLKQKISEVKSACNSAGLSGYDCNKVDLVAHSMGGLVARDYIEGDGYVNDVDQLIFLATPQQGAPMAYLAWEGGEAGTGLTDSVMWNIMFSEAQEKGYFTNFSYFRGLPMLSLKELLPTYSYLRDKGSDSLRNYPYNYPQNEFLEKLNDSLNLTKLNNVNILNIVADNNKNNTINAFRVVPKNSSIGMWEFGYPENYWLPFTDHGLELGAGDKTVPIISNNDFNNFRQTIVNNSSHTDVVTDAQKQVVKELTGNMPEKEVKKSFIKKYFMIRIFSPADFVIIAPDGKKVGKDFVNGGVINEINGAFYSGKFATIPDPIDGEYKIELQGTGNGEYQLSVSGIDEAASTNKDFFGQITTGANQDFKIDYSSSSPELLADLEPQDATPPSLIISSPLEGNTYKHSEKMTIGYQASDDFSGIASVEIKIDDKSISSTTVNLFDYQVGAHLLSIIVQDRTGNFTENNVSFSIVANIKSTIADIEEIYKRGWLKSYSRKSFLIAELKILDAALALLEKTRSEINKKIEEVRNNQSLSAEKKKILIADLNKKLAELGDGRQKIIKLNLAIFEKTLNEAKGSSYFSQSGYDMIKGDLEYLKNNL